MILESFDLIPLVLHLLLRFEASLNPCLYLKRIFLKQCKLLYQLVLLLHELLIVRRQLFGILSAHLKLCFKLSNFLIELISLEFITSVIFYHLSLIFCRILQCAFDMIELHDLSFHGKLFAF